jgi:hypothetical protein
MALILVQKDGSRIPFKNPHGNKKTIGFNGQPTTYGAIRRAATAAAQNLIKALSDPSGRLPV